MPDETKRRLLSGRKGANQAILVLKSPVLRFFLESLDCIRANGLQLNPGLFGCLNHGFQQPLGDTLPAIVRIDVSVVNAPVLLVNRNGAFPNFFAGFLKSNRTVFRFNKFVTDHAFLAVLFNCGLRRSLLPESVKASLLLIGEKTSFLHRITSAG